MITDSLKNKKHTIARNMSCFKTSCNEEVKEDDDYSGSFDSEKGTASRKDDCNARASECENIVVDQGFVHAVIDGFLQDMQNMRYDRTEVMC